MTEIYENITERYRPKKLEDFVGQESMARTVRGMLASEKISRTIMISGAHGLGKTSMARVIAMAVNCQARTGGNPCGTCESCKLIAKSDSSTSIHEINAADARGIDEARKLISTSQYAPRGAKYRVIILDEVQQLSEDAFSVLLKIFERPSSATIFILCTTSPTKIPDAIQSRCLHLTVRQVSADLMAKYLQKIAKLEGVAITQKVALQIASASRGFLRDALNLLESFLNNVAGAKQGEVPDVQKLMDDLLGDAADSFGIDFVNGLLTADTHRCLGLLGRVRNHPVFCDSVTRLLVQVARACHNDPERQSLRDPELGEFFDAVSEQLAGDTDAPLKIEQTLTAFVEAAAKVKAFKTNDPTAVLVAAALRACRCFRSA